MKEIIFFDSNEKDKSFFSEKCINKYKCIFVRKSLKNYIDLTEEMKKANVISCFTLSQLNSDYLKMFSNLELIALRCVGFNNVDIDYCKRKGIKVVSAKNYGNRTVAEFSFGLILNVLRNISRSYINLINETNFKPNYTGIELYGKTLGIIGVGAIGAELAKIAYNFGIKVLGYDIIKNKELEEKIKIEYVSLDELLMRSDIVSLHSPLTKNNYHLINDEKLALMKESAIIINTARGELIDTKALYKALSFGTIFGAGLDVLECEETINDIELKYDMDYLDKYAIKQILLNHEITKLENVVVTPHIAYDTKEAKKRIQEITFDNIESYFAGKLKNNVY